MNLYKKVFKQMIMLYVASFILCLIKKNFLDITVMSGMLFNITYQEQLNVFDLILPKWKQKKNNNKATYQHKYYC